MGHFQKLDKFTRLAGWSASIGMLFTMLTMHPLALLMSADAGSSGWVWSWVIMAWSSLSSLLAWGACKLSRAVLSRIGKAGQRWQA
jgi:hypothetical protein